MEFKRFQKSVSFFDKGKYSVHVRPLKQALNHGLILNKVQRIITSNQKT